MVTSGALQRAIQEAVAVLRGKGVVAFPTDTIYGLGADAFSVEAVARVFSIKGRPQEMGMPLLLGSIRDLDKVTSDVPDLARTFVERFWPGPLTLILTKSTDVPSAVTGGKDSVAVRMPDHEVPLMLIRELGGPITGTSANPTGGPDPTTAEDVRRLLKDKVDFLLDGGPSTSGRASTILDFTGPSPKVVRSGAIAIECLQSFCPVPLDVP